VREELLTRRSQRPEPVAAAQQRESETVVAEPHGDVASIEDAQLEQSARPVAMDGESTSVEAPHDSPPDAEIDQDADPHTNPDMVQPERSRHQKRDCRVIAWRGPPRGRCEDMESHLRAGREPEPPRAQAEPGRSVTDGPHSRLAPK